MSSTMTFAGIWHFLVAHLLLVFAIMAAIWVVVARVVWWIATHSPVDRTGNGIVIGQAKVFDNRSLALRVERLSAELERLKVVNQNITDSASATQAQISTQSTQSFSLEVKGAGKPAEQAKGSPKDEKPAAAAAPAKTEGAAAPKVGLAAGDPLSDQLNLASQIFNL